MMVTTPRDDFVNIGTILVLVDAQKAMLIYYAIIRSWTNSIGINIFMPGRFYIQNTSHKLCATPNNLEYNSQ